MLEEYIYKLMHIDSEKKFGRHILSRAFYTKGTGFNRHDALKNTAKDLFENLKELGNINTTNDDHDLIDKNLAKLHEFLIHPGKNKMFNTIKRHIKIKNPKKNYKYMQKLQKVP